MNDIDWGPDDFFDDECLGEVVGFISDSNYIVVLVNEGMAVDLNDQVFLQGKKQRPWVGLTNKERSGIEDYCEMIIGKAAFDAIEAKLKEKNT